MKPQVLARVAGALYLISIILGIVGELFIRGRIVVAGNAMATAANLRSMEFLWRMGVASELVQGVITIVLAWILYVLLRPVSRELALLATFFNVVAISIESAYSMQLLQALFPLGSNGYLKAFSPEQLSAMAMLAVKSHVFGFGIALFLFGPFFLVAGYLIFRSGYFPKFLGVLYPLAGLAYMTNGLMLVLAPSLADQLFAVIAGPAFLAEASFCLWLLVKGVNVEKWSARAARLA